MELNNVCAPISKKINGCTLDSTFIPVPQISQYQSRVCPFSLPTSQSRSPPRWHPQPSPIFGVHSRDSFIPTLPYPPLKSTKQSSRKTRILFSLTF